MRAADQVMRLGLAKELEKLENRLSQWEDMAADGDMPRARFIQRRDEVLPRIQELKAQLVARPHLGLPDIDQLFTIIENVTPDNLSFEGWRDLVESTVERIVIEGHDIRVAWKSEYQPLLAQR